MCVSEGVAKEAEHGESWFLPEVEDQVARIDKDGKAIIDKFSMLIFFLHNVWIYFNLDLFSGVIKPLEPT